MIESLPRIQEIGRVASPVALPQGLACDAQRLFVSSRETCRLYELDPRSLAIQREIDPPGMPWGLALRGEAVIAVCGEGPDDDRYLHEYVDAKGWNSGVPCPDLTGSYLACGDGTLYLTQWYNRRVFRLSAGGQVAEAWTAPREICGACFRDGVLYLVTTDDEYTSAYYLTRADLDSSEFADVAAVLFPARSLAWNGSEFLTNHREQGEIVRFIAGP